MPTVETTVRAIEANVAAWKSEAASIQANTSLTALARNQQLNGGYNAAFERHSNLFAEMRAEVETERQTLTEALLAGSGDDLSIRDSMDRARNAKNGKELRELLDQANLTSDQPLVRAVSYEAVRRHLWDTLKAAADAGFAPAAKLLDFEQTYGSLQSTQAGFALKIRTSGPSRVAGM